MVIFVEWETLRQSQWKSTSSLTEGIWKENIMRFFITPLQKRHQCYRTECWSNNYHIFCENLNLVITAPCSTVNSY